MRIFHVKDFVIRWSAVIISVAANVALFQNILIQFPIQPEPFKPKFIFLGQILNIIAAPKNNGNKPFPNTEKNAPEIIYSNQQSTNKNQITITKPITSPIIKAAKKVHLKTHFLKTDKNAQKQTSPIENNSIPLTVNPYRPLRMQQQ